MKNFLLLFYILFTFQISFGQEVKTNSETRKFIDDATFTQINKDWNIIAEFKSGFNEVVSFFPVEAIDLKSQKRVRSLQMDMTVLYQVGGQHFNYFKSSWIDLTEVEEFIYFIEEYIVPNLKDKTERNQSLTYVYNSNEITFSFHIEGKKRRISIYLKDQGITDNQHFFWTETQVHKIPDLLTMLKQIK